MEAVASDALTQKEVAQLGVDRGISKQKLTDNFGIPDSIIPKTKTQDDKENTTNKKDHKTKKQDGKSNHAKNKHTNNTSTKTNKVNNLISNLSTVDVSARRESLKELASNNVPPSEFADAKIPARELLDANYSVQQLVDSDISPKDMLEQGVQASEIRDSKGFDKAGLPLNSYTMSLKYDITPAKLRQDGIDTKQMLKDGLKPWVLRQGKGGLTTEQMIRDGADVMPTSSECDALKKQIWAEEKKDHNLKLKQARDEKWNNGGRKSFWKKYNDAKLNRNQKKLLDSIKTYNKVTEHTQWDLKDFDDMHSNWFEASYTTEDDDERAKHTGTISKYGLKQKDGWTAYSELRNNLLKAWKKPVKETIYSGRFLKKKDYVAQFKKNLKL